MIKRLLTIILTLIFALSSVAAFATEEIPAEDISVEEIEALEPAIEEETQAEEEIALEPMADAEPTIGTLGRTYSVDFSEYTAHTTAGQKNSYGLRLRYGGENILPTNDVLTDDGSEFGTVAGNKYLWYTYEASRGKTHPHIYTNDMKITGITDHKIHFSFDLKTNDYNADKVFYFSNKHNTYSPISAGLGNDGYIGFGNKMKGEIPYSLNRWYSFDVVFDYGTAQNIKYYLDGNLVYTDEALPTKDRLNFFVFDIINPYDTTDTTLVADICIDNIGIAILDSDETPEIVSKDVPLYNNFSKLNTARAIGTFTHTVAIVGETLPVEYSLEDGAFKKSVDDKSLKVVVDEEFEAFVENGGIDGLIIDGTDGLSAYSSYNLTAGQQIKLSQSFAYKSNSGNVYANLLANTETVNLIKLTNDGSLYLAGTDTEVNLAAERWYNLDAIITVESDLDLLVDLYVNGNLVANGTIAYDEAYSKLADSINISKIIFGADAASETYYDDVYVNTFSGTGEDVAAPNAAISESSDLIDTSDEIGKALVDPGMLLDDFVAAVSSDANIKVYANGEEAVSGYAANTLVVSGEETYLPTYCYVYATVVLDDPTFTPGTGKVTVSTNVASMLSNPRTITLFVATYVKGDDGISRIYSVKPQTIDCIGQTNEYSIDVAIPETYFDTVIPESPAEDSTEDETTEEPVVLEAPAEKVNIKVFTTTGWEENLPAFGNVWTTSLYDLLTAE